MKTRSILLAVLVSAGAAYAGHQQSDPVTISRGTTSTAAHGSIRGARISADTVQYLGCSLYNYSGGFITVCSARDASGAYFACNAQNNDAMARAVASIGPISRIYFQSNNSAPGTCTTVNVTNHSMYAAAD